MSQTTRSPGRMPYARALSAGFLAGFILFLFNRWILVKFPINLIMVGLMMYAGLGLALGVRAGGRGLDALRPRSLALALSSGVWLFALLANQNVTTHYLLGSVYYPYPLPANAYLRVAGVLFSVLLSPVPLYVAGYLFGDALRRAPGGPAALGWFALGMAAAAPAGFFALLGFGVYAPLILGVALLLAFLPDRRWAALGLLVCAGAAWTTTHNNNEAFYIWRIDQYDHLSTHWSPYYRLDFITFKDGQCMGGVYNTVMIWYACDTPENYPAEMRRLLGEAARGKERVLLAGRTDGLYAGMILAANPDIRRYESVAFDPVAAEMMSGPYARYNGGVFRRPGMSVDSADIRQAIRARVRAGETYDLIFLNGIGIRLFNMPHSVFMQEDYLTARENYHDIFGKLLSRNGVFIIDWGSSMEDEVYPMMANIPDDVHVRVFHVWIGEFPLSGLPLFYVVASRDRDQLDRIAAKMLAMPTVREIKLKPRMIAKAKFTENRPVHNKPLAPGLLALMFPFFILLAAVTAHAGFGDRWRMPAGPWYVAWYAAILILLYRMFVSGNLGAVITRKDPLEQGTRVAATFLVLLLVLFFAQYLVRSLLKWRRAFGAGRGRIATYFWVAGLAAGLAETFVFSRLARHFPGGPGYGVVWAGAAWWLGFTLAAVFARLTNRKPGARVYGIMIPLLVAVFFLLFVPKMDSLLSGLAGAPLLNQQIVFPLMIAALGLFAASFLMIALPGVPRDFRARALGLMFLGSLAGLYLFQWLAVIFGYFLSSMITGAVFFIVVFFLHRAKQDFENGA